MTDLLIDLENMAADFGAAADDIKLQDVRRWQGLFRLLPAQAHHEIEQWRAKFDRLHVPDDLWELVRDDKEREGYDREAYEYAMWLTASGAGGRQISAKGSSMSAASPSASTSSNTSYILKLEEPLESAEKVQSVAQLSVPPPVTVGVGESGDASFCTIDSRTCQKISEWVATQHPTFRPTIVRLSKSPKALGSDSMAPMLGFDATMPQHRPSDPDFRPEPAQDQYPVWYFFYGNLAKPEELQRRLGLSESPEYVPTVVRGGRIRSWRGKYRALVDANVDDPEDGSAYLVLSREHEDILRFYETEKYEVVRCRIEMGDRVQNGLVFRFAGQDYELE